MAPDDKRLISAFDRLCNHCTLNCCRPGDRSCIKKQAQKIVWKRHITRAQAVESILKVREISQRN